jgi:heptosyltransferase-2
MKPPQRILVIRPDRIGDVTLATPTIRALRRSFPHAYIAAMIRPSTEPVLRHNPHLDAILFDDWEKEYSGRSGFINRLRMLRGHRFDTALMLLPSERHAWMTLLAGIRTRVGVGTKLYQVLTLARSVSRNKYVDMRHEADYCLDLARSIGARDDGLAVEAFLLDEEVAAARTLLEKLGWNRTAPTISVHPENGGSSANWNAETYRNFVIACAEAIPDAHIMVQITRTNAAMRELFAPLRSDRIHFPDDGGDLRMVMALIAQADVALTSSTGPMHLAAALKVPSVNLFCPLPACRPSLWGPLGNKSTNIMPPEDYCQTRCPGDPQICTFDGGIELPQVLNAVEEQLRTISSDSSR